MHYFDTPTATPDALITSAREYSKQGDTTQVSVLLWDTLRQDQSQETLKSIATIMTTSFAKEGQEYDEEATALNKRRGIDWLRGQPRAARLEVGRDRAFRRVGRWARIANQQ